MIGNCYRVVDNLSKRDKVFMKDAFISKFQARRAQVAVIGLGYVGLPLAVNFAKAG